VTNNPTGFLDIPRKAAGYRGRDERLRDWREVERQLPEDQARRQAERCMDCGIPFCHGCGCPLANQIPELHALAQHGRWREALDLQLSTSNFPEFTGRVCPAPCEGSCVLGLVGEPVTIRNIELAVIEMGFAEGWMKPRPPATRLPTRVAVIGSGPAGLATADSLNRIGHRVTVYENAPRPGGILRYGIPEFKLEKAVIDRRVQLMRDEGVVFECGVQVGDDLSTKFLFSRFDAIVLTGGAREPRDLTVPGRELSGIHFAMDYLRGQNLRLDGDPVPPAYDITATGKRVVVIGGGDTGSDCLGTALRQGATSALQLEILPEPPATRAPANPWPAWPLIRRDSSSHQEGGERRWCVTTIRACGQAGAVSGLRCAAVEWLPGAGGRPQMRIKPDSEFDVPADLVLLAMGFTGPRKNKLLLELGVSFDGRGTVVRDADNQTTVPGVFAAGDLARGASLVVRAIADGRATAESVHRWLAKNTAKR
jgi:glutamate synthase (NADPH/NADH) small chain